MANNLPAYLPSNHYAGCTIYLATQLHAHNGLNIIPGCTTTTPYNGHTVYLARQLHTHVGLNNTQGHYELVSWSLTSLFSTNMAISETKGHYDYTIQWPHEKIYEATLLHVNSKRVT